MQRKLLGIIIVDFYTTDQLMITFYAFVIFENKWEYNEVVHQLFIDFKKAWIQLGRRSCIIFSLTLVYS
jgi:hypothetical protein